MLSSRRWFLCNTVSVGGVISFAGVAPRLLLAAQPAAPAPTDRKLVVVFLDGGNDGLNMVAPVHDPLYQRYRVDTRIEPDSGLRLTDQLSLHPAMRGAAEIWQAGRLAVVQGVGYPEHSRSHFVSQAVWHAAQLDAELGISDGWLGRSLDAQQTQIEAPLACSVGFAETPPALRGRLTRTIVPPDISPDDARRAQALLAIDQHRPFSSADRQHVARVQRDAASALEQLLPKRAMKPGDFPGSLLGQQLSQAAWLIRSNNPARVYYLRHSGYDTHAGQHPQHARLLRELADGIGAFDRAMDQAGLSDQVTVMVFSEFGRRVAENRSGGTDHGAAGPVLLVGGGYVPGLHGEPYDLETLDDGDLRVTTDFRSVYATVLQHSLQINPQSVLPQSFQPLPQLRA